MVKDPAGNCALVYYVNKRLLDAKLWYPKLERLTLMLVTSTKKLRYYFLAHPMIIFTNHPMKEVLHKLEVLGKLVKWTVEWTQLDISYQSCTVIKGQVLADFIIKFNLPSKEDQDLQEKLLKWKLYVDESSKENGSRAGFMLISLKNHHINNALRFNLKA